MIALNACKHRIAVGTIHPLIKNRFVYLVLFFAVGRMIFFCYYDVMHYPNCEHAPAERCVFFLSVLRELPLELCKVAGFIWNVLNIHCAWKSSAC